MKLIIKFNLVLLPVGVLGLCATALLAWHTLQQRAQEESIQTARVMMESASAMRDYTTARIVPLLESHIRTEFLSEAIPSFAATEAFRLLHRTLPAFGYKEAALNPTNPRNRVVEWEADILNRFRSDPDLREMTGQRDTPTGRSLYLARPIRIQDPACLACHDTPGRAPHALLERYGTGNGFGWRMHETVAAQVVSVPAQVAADRAQQTFVAFMGAMVAVFTAICVALNLMLLHLVIRPLNRLSNVAEQISLGDVTAPEIEIDTQDEVGTLARAFGRMRLSVEKALEFFDQ